MYHLGIDLGGTNIVAGVVDENYKIIATDKVKTNAPRPAEEIIDDMVKVALGAAEKAGVAMSDIEEVGVGSPGSVDSNTGVIAYANNLKFKNVQMGAMLKEKLNKDVYVANDANAAAFGEQLAGAGKGSKDFIMITLGTGVGGGIICNGKMVSGTNGAGGEAGHIVIVKDGEQCSCGRKGCWEAYASATALGRQTKRAMEDNTDSLMWEICGGNLDNVNGRTAFDAMRKGDAAGKKVVDNYIDYISCGVVNMVNLFQPEVLCIGGGISNEGESLTFPIVEYVERERYSKNIDKQTKICVAELANSAGIIGAAFLSKIVK